tara:strand:- start:225 stop:929 length:705 start_codon:yes stop_codon:yes gene_type:complete
MALPKLDTPTYQLELPSNQQVVKYRPFLVKEQKILMMAQDADDKEDSYNMLAEIVDGCTFNNIDIKTMPIFDFEYLFMKIRCKSVGESADLNILCPDDNETRVPVTIDLDEIDVQVEDGHSNVVGVNDSIKIVMRYPTVNDIKSVGEAETLNNVMTLLKVCIHEIHDGDTIHNMIDVTSKELDEFIDSLPTDTFEKMAIFFDTMPKLTHVVEVKNPKTEVTSEVVIQGMDSFFS